MRIANFLTLERQIVIVSSSCPHLWRYVLSYWLILLHRQTPVEYPSEHADPSSKPVVMYMTHIRLQDIVERYLSADDAFTDPLVTFLKSLFVNCDIFSAGLNCLPDVITMIENDYFLSSVSEELITSCRTLLLHSSLHIHGALNAEEALKLLNFDHEDSLKLFIEDISGRGLFKQVSVRIEHGTVHANNLNLDVLTLVCKKSYVCIFPFIR
jgi:hypothetical protein